jgi:hypothetical protein
MEQLEVKETNQISSAQIRAEISNLETEMKANPSAISTIDVMHHYTNGVYARTVLMKAGDLIVGKIHKHEHLVIVSAGRARVVSEEFGAKEIVAPSVFKSPPGVKRALLILEDMIWTTIHKNEFNIQDMAVLEDELIAKDYSEVTV